MLEKHPFSVFVPANAKYLVLGSFVGRRFKGYNWYYSNRVNQFWPILSVVYRRQLNTKKEKQKLFTELKIAVSDIILKCERKENNNADTSLINATYNTGAIGEVLATCKIEKIFFSSRFVENKFRTVFSDLIKKYPKIELITLPSPSPRYAKLTLMKKIKIYQKLLSPACLEVRPLACGLRGPTSSSL